MPKNFFLLTLIIYLLFLPVSYAAENITILVNKNKIHTDVPPFISNETTYVPLRFISEALDTDNVIWNKDIQSVTIKKDTNTLIFFINKNYAFINNLRKEINGTPIIKNNRTFVPLRIISENLDANVEWNENTRTISIFTKQNTSSNRPQQSTSSNSNSLESNKPSNNISNNSNLSDSNDAVYWLSRIIEAESSGEPYKGKVAVGEVILNRVNSDKFPNTIWGVIFDDNFGIQFEPVANGSIYNTPSAESIKAAKEALNGSNYSKNSLYFLNPTIASSNWIIKNREFCITIANHDFYL